MSEQRPKRSPAETWEALQKSRLRQEGERVAKMSRAELDASLEARGVDANAARERGAALAAKLLAQRTSTAAPQPAVAPEPAPAEAQEAPAASEKVVSLAAEREKRRRPLGFLLLVAAASVAVVVGGGGALYVALQGPEPAPTGPVPSVPTAPTPPPELLAKQEADRVRGEAMTLCDQRRWSACLAELRRADALDPAGGASRANVRLEAKMERAANAAELDAKPGSSAPRSVSPELTAAFTAALSSHTGQALRLACAPGAEPQQLCTQLAAALKKAGWVVTRPRLAAPPSVDGVEVHKALVQVTPDADDATQAAADALADALAGALLRTAGPDDAPGAEAPLTLVVGSK